MATEREFKRAAVYVRVSTKEQNPGMQLDDISKYCGLRGWEIVSTVTEKMSGAKRRPERQKLIEALKHGAADVVVVWKLDRWGRSNIDLATTVKKLFNAGIGFASVRESIDLTTPAGRLMFNMLCAFAEFERDTIIERVTTGLQHAKRHGTRTGKAIGRPATAAERKPRIDALVAQGVSLPEIARRLEMPYSSVHRLAQPARHK